MLLNSLNGCDMQHTKLDRWLCKKFVHINRIYFNTMPEALPQDLEIDEAGEESGARYKYRATTTSEETAKDACEVFAAQNIMYTARVDEKTGLLARFVGNPNRSVTMLAIWIGLFIFSLLFILSGVVPTLISNLLQDKVEIKAVDKKQIKRGRNL